MLSELHKANLKSCYLTGSWDGFFGRPVTDEDTLNTVIGDRLAEAAETFVGSNDSILSNLVVVSERASYQAAIEKGKEDGERLRKETTRCGYGRSLAHLQNRPLWPIYLPAPPSGRVFPFLPEWEIVKIMYN